MNHKNKNSKTRTGRSSQTVKRQLEATQATLDQLHQTHAYINAFFESYVKIGHS